MYINGANFDSASGAPPPDRLVVVANRLPVSAFKVRWPAHLAPVIQKLQKVGFQDAILVVPGLRCASGAPASVRQRI